MEEIQPMLEIERKAEEQEEKFSGFSFLLVFPSPASLPMDCI